MGASVLPLEGSLKIATEGSLIKLYLNPANKAKPCCKIRWKKVESSRDLRLENQVKEVPLFDEEYTTKRDKKTTENQDGDEWEGTNGTRRAVTGTYLHGEIIIQETGRRSSRS